MVAIPRPSISLHDHEAQEFIKDANSYYCEWFYFALQKTVWINCWDKVNDVDSALIHEEYPAKSDQFLQQIEESVAEFQRTVLTKVILSFFPNIM